MDIIIKNQQYRVRTEVMHSGLVSISMYTSTPCVYIR